MPKERRKKRDGNNPNPETALQEAAVSGAVITEIHLDYVGPDYDLGIKIPGEKNLVRPREFSPAQIAEFTEKHPRFTGWWLPAGK